MSIISLLRILKFAWQGFWRNFWLSLITISIIVLVLISINILIILNLITESAVESLQEKIDISIYFDNETAEEKVLEVKDFFENLSEVANVKYVSQDEALASFKKRHKNNTLILQSLSEIDKNPLGATLIVKAKSISQYPQIISILENSKYDNLVMDKNYEDHENFIKKIQQISGRINNTGIIITSIFIFIAILIVFNTIRVAIYTHSEEIGIMKLVGANNIFITAPFIIESMIYGIIGLSLSGLITYLILNFLQPYVSNFFSGAEVDIISYFKNNFLLIGSYQLIGVILLNIISCSIAIRRYLKV